MANILECCKAFEKYLNKTEDEPTKWHLKFKECFEPYMSKKSNLTRAEEILQAMHDKLTKAKQNWTVKDYQKIFTDFKPEHSDSEIDAPRIAQYFSKTFPDEIACCYAFSFGHGKLDGYSAMIISKYLKNAKDIANLEKASKKFHTTPDKFKYNPVPLTNEDARKLFPNIEIQYIYGPDDMIFDDGKIKEHHILDFGSKKGAFLKQDQLKNVIISNKINEIPEYAFQGCEHLTSVVIPSSVKRIRDHAFWGCTSLKSITIPSSITIIDDGAFGCCKNLESVTISSGVKYIENSVFYKCKSLKSVTFPSSVLSIGLDAFRGCESLKSVTIPSSVHDIDDSFSECTSLESVTIPKTCTTVYPEAFFNCRDGLELVFNEGISNRFFMGNAHVNSGNFVIKYRGNISEEIKQKFIDAFCNKVTFKQI